MFPQTTSDVSSDIELLVTSTTESVVFIEMFTPSNVELDVSSYRLEPRSHVVVSLPSQLRSTGSGISDLGVVLSATEPVTVHMVSLERRSCGGFMAIPDNRLGYDYVAIGYQSGSIQQIGVVAAESEVQLAIVLPPGLVLEYDGATFNGSNGDVIEGVVLPPFNVLQLQGAFADDLTGVRVVSTNRIAVFSGSIITNVDFLSQDHIVDQLLPRGASGRIFNVVPVPGRLAGVTDTLRIVSLEANNRVFIGPDDVNAEVQLERIGSFAEIVTSQQLQVRAQQEVAVMQFSASRIAGDNGEPAMFLVPPVSHFKRVFFFTIPTSASLEFIAYVILTAPTQATDTITLDNLPLDTFVTSWQPIASPANDFSGATISVTSGSHVLLSSDVNVRFSALVYIFDQSECAVAFPAGMCLEYTLEVRPMPPILLSHIP